MPRPRLFSPAFWWLQLAGWTAYAAAGLALVPGLFPVLPLRVAVVLWAVEWTLGLGFSTALALWYRRWAGPARPLLLRFALALLSSAVAGALWAACSLSAWRVMGRLELFGGSLRPTPPTPSAGASLLLAWAFVAVCATTVLGVWSSLHLGIQSWREARRQSEHALRARALAQEAELRMLRYQINPHFLFNALNALRGLADEDPRRAQEMVDELAGFLRYSLLPARDLEVPLREELEAVRAYLAVERTRFEERLQVAFAVDPASQAAVVPAFLLHPLVENAVKYGMQTSPARLCLAVEASSGAEGLLLRVRNTGALLPPAEAGRDPARTGVGLRNVRQRLEHAFPGRHRFRLFESGGWVHAEIEIGAPAGGRA